MKAFTITFLLALGYVGSTLSFSEEVCSDRELVLSIENIDQMQIGSLISLNLVFANSAPEPLYLEFSGSDFGAHHLNILAEMEGCEVVVDPAHIDRSIEDHRFDFIPLMPNSSVKIPIILNSTGGPPLLPIHKEGRYKLRLTYTSKGSIVEGLLWPIWRGCITSNEISVLVNPPSADKLNQMRGRVNECLKKESCEDFEAIGFFQVVRDNAAAEAIAKLIEKKPKGLLLVELAQSVRNQHRKQDIEVLQSIIAQNNVDTPTKDFLRRIVQELETHTPCSL